MKISYRFETFLKLLIFVFFVSIFYQKRELTLIDYYIYELMYETPIETWYVPPYGLYYAPTFYYLFYPFHLMGPNIYFVICLTIFLFGIVYSFLKMKLIVWTIFLLFLKEPFWGRYHCGNIDLIFFSALIFLWYSKLNDKWKGIILGFLSFKGTLLFVIPFFIWKTKNKKVFIFNMAIGVFINYCYFLYRYDLILQFIHQISCVEHARGISYLSPINSLFFSPVLCLFLQEYYVKYNNRKNINRQDV